MKLFTSNVQTFLIIIRKPGSRSSQLFSCLYSEPRKRTPSARVEVFQKFLTDYVHCQLLELSLSHCTNRIAY